MEKYTGFARVYDEFMDDIPYEEWAEYICSILSEYGIEKGLLLDLGCGTGSLCQIMAEKGFDVIGVDNSEDMLGIAREKALESGQEILYLLQDMRQFELYGTVGAVVSVCDSLNYILDKDQLLAVFKLVNNYLDPGGIFVFDMNTRYKYEEIMAENTIAENRQDCSFIWENYYYAEEGINEYELSIFVKREDGAFDRFQETHYEKMYEIEEVKALLAAAGLEFLAVYDAFTKSPPLDDSQRIYFVAREKGK